MRCDVYTAPAVEPLCVMEYNIIRRHCEYNGRLKQVREDLKLGHVISKQSYLCHHNEHALLRRGHWGKDSFQLDPVSMCMDQDTNPVSTTMETVQLARHVRTKEVPSTKGFESGLL